MKRLLSLLSIFILIFTLCSCAVKTEINMPGDSSDWHDMQFISRDIRVNFKGSFTLEELLSLGFSTTYENSPSVIPLTLDPEEEYKTIIVDDNNDYAFAIKVKNVTDKKMGLKKCRVMAIAALMTDDGADLTLANGITGGTTKEQILELMGEPDAIDDNSTALIWYYYPDENNTDSYVMFKLDSDTESVYLISLFY